jgi:hypothetical protein
LNYKFLIIVGLIALVIVLGFGDTASIEFSSLEKASGHLISDDKCSATYDFIYERQDGWTTSCSDYSFTYSLNMPSSQMPSLPEGTQLNTWVYGEVTQDFSILGIVNYQSGVERRDSNSAFINNSKVECKLTKVYDNPPRADLTCRFTGQCNIKEGISAPYGFGIDVGKSGSAEVTFVKDIPSCQEEVKQEEVVQQQIKQEQVQNPPTGNTQPSTVKLGIIDRINLMFQDFIDWLRGGFK